MSDVLQRLHQLDKSFAQELEKLLQNEKHVGGLLQLPEKELIHAVNYLNDVRFPPVKLTWLIVAFIDHHPFHSHRRAIQKVSTRVAEDMWCPKSSPHPLRCPWYPFIF